MQPALVGAWPRVVGWLDAGTGAFARGARGVLGLVTWVWLAEAGFDAAGGGRFGGRVEGLLLALFVGVAAALPLGVFVGLVGWASVPADGRDARGRVARAWSWLWEADARAQRDRVAATFAVLLAVVLGSGVAFERTRAAVLDVAQPHFTALVILAWCGAIALAVAWLHPALRRLGDFVAFLGARFRAVGVVFGSAGRLLVASALAVAGVAVALSLRSLASFAYLPWRALGALALGCALALAWSLSAHRLARLVTRLVRAIAVSLWIASVAAAVSLDASDLPARRIALDTQLGRAGYAVVDRVLDFDRDGHLHVLGGGDCAPFDPAQSPAAIDVPENGVDEDCDGIDLGKRLLASARTRLDWPVPDDVPRTPPIVFLTIDAFAARRMAALGGKSGLTPKLDAFAERSTLFTRCFSQGPSTRLSFPSIFTSRWDSEIRQELVGRHPYPIHASEELLAERLQKAGYDTVAVLPDPYFGKGHWPSLTQGFRSVVDRPYKARPAPLHNAPLVTDAAIDVLRARRERPLFLWVHYYDAHSPHAQPEGIAERGRSREARYDAELALVDREAGRLLDAVASALPDAVIVVTADHGIAFDVPRHEQFNYGYDLHTAVLHVPLFVAAPFVRRQRIEEIVSTMDIAPTLANLLRLRRQERYRGASLVPELLEGRATRPQRLHHQFYLEERLWKDEEPLELVSLRTERFNLIQDRRVGSWELYDWTHDYFEVEDLSGRAEYAKTLLALKQQLALLTYEVYRGQAPHAERAGVR